MKLLSRPIPAAAIWLALGGAPAAAAPVIAFDCGAGCLDRSDFAVKAIVHGTEGDPLWREIRAAAAQAAAGMNVGFDMELYDSFDSDRMAAEIRDFAADPAPNTGLLVSIPNAAVSEAVAEAVELGIPVVGINSGSSFGKDAGAMGFIAPDYSKGGVMAADKFAELRGGSIGTALFVTTGDDIVYESSLALGLEDKGAKVTQIDVDAADASGMEALIAANLEGCAFDAVLLSNPLPLAAAIAAYEKQGCTLEGTSLGTFETSDEVYTAIGEDKLDFAIANNHYLQGALGGVLAALATTKGKALAASADHSSGAYLTGPRLITKMTTPTDSQKVCEADAFPVCPNTKAPDGTKAKCSCTDRSTIKIGGVTHGTSTDSFWDPVFAASEQAAKDMGIELLNQRFDARDAQGSTTLHTRMANRIEELCVRTDVDGIFVTIPSETVVPAIQKCMDLGIPVISVNAGADTSKSMGLAHHIGMLEINAGKGLGEKLIKLRGITSGVCVNHAEGVSVVEERCAGFAAALEDAGLPYLGQVYVPDDNEAVYLEKVESFVNQTGDWSGIGLVAAGPPQHGPAISLQKRHPGLKVAAFDLSPKVFEAIDAGNIVFGVDQEPYIQGYMPIIFLTVIATSGQDISNQVVESGPAFAMSSPSQDQLACAEVFYMSCEVEEPVEVTAAENTEGKDATNVGLIAGVAVLGAAVLLLAGYFVHRMNAVNKHIAELEARGKTVRRMSMSQRALSVVKSPSEVVKTVEEDDEYTENPRD